MRTISATGNDRRGRDGFTLIELSAVVFVIALLLALSAPRFVRSYNGMLLSETARNFTTTCQLARVQAVTHQRPAVVHLDLSGQRFWLTQASTNEVGDSAERTVKVFELSPRVLLVAATPLNDEPQEDIKLLLITFYPNGTCDGGTAVFRGEHDKLGLAVTIDPITGKAVSYQVAL